MAHDHIPRANPVRGADGGWYWYDENDDPHGPYIAQNHALRSLLRHMDKLNGITPWQQFKAALWEFIHA